MFTIKYVYPTGEEMLSGPYGSVSAGWTDAEGNHVHDPAARPVENGKPASPVFQVIHAHDRKDGSRLTIGPNLPVNGEPQRPSKVFVMNENGATVARYDL